MFAPRSYVRCCASTAALSFRRSDRLLSSDTLFRPSSSILASKAVSIVSGRQLHFKELEFVAPPEKEGHVPKQVSSALCVAFTGSMRPHVRLFRREREQERERENDSERGKGGEVYGPIDLRHSCLRARLRV